MSFLAEKSRKQLRALVGLDNTRPDGTRHTMPSASQRKKANRRRAKVSKAARKVNR